MIRHQQNKFVATEAGQRVCVADTGSQAFGHDLEQLVAGLMTETVIDQFEVVEIDEHHGQQQPVALGIGDRLGQPVLQQIAIGQAGNGVVIGLMYDSA